MLYYQVKPECDQKKRCFTTTENLAFSDCGKGSNYTGDSLRRVAFLLTYSLFLYIICLDIV